MKLYAKTTSERASKGQGGNEKLVINLMTEKKGERKEIGNLVFSCTSYSPDNDIFEATYYPINDNCTEQKINSGKVVLYKTPNKCDCIKCSRGATNISF